MVETDPLVFQCVLFCQVQPNQLDELIINDPCMLNLLKLLQ